MHQSHYGKMISMLYRIGKTIVAILHIYGALAIFLLFFCHQDTESESRDTEIDVAGPPITGNNLKGSMGQQYP